MVKNVCQNYLKGLKEFHFKLFLALALASGATRPSLGVSEHPPNPQFQGLKIDLCGYHHPNYSSRSAPALDYFLPFWSPNNPENQTFEKMKKTCGAIIILHSTINENHMMYGSWDMEHDRQNCFSFWTIFCPYFTSLITQKTKILKKLKNTWRYYHFTQVYHKYAQSCDVCFLRYEVGQTEFIHFRPVFVVLPY